MDASPKQGLFSVLKRTVSDFSEDECTTLSAAIAYYTVFSLPPLLVLIVSIAGFFWKPDDVRAAMDEQAQNLVGDEASQQVATMLEHANKPGHGLIGTTVGAIVLIIGATGVMGQLQMSLNRVWEVKADPKQGGLWQLVTKRLLSFGMILGIAFLLLVSLVLSAVLTAFADTISGWLPGNVSPALPMIVNTVVSFVVITLLFAAMFKVLPDVEVAWKDVWIGAVVTAVLFTIGKYLLGLYFATADIGSTYGLAGSLALILVWIYYSAMILLVGAEFTQAWARRHGREITPSAGAVRVVEQNPASAAGQPRRVAS